MTETKHNRTSRKLSNRCARQLVNIHFEFQSTSGAELSRKKTGDLRVGR
jgi:hypothetical protein